MKIKKTIQTCRCFCGAIEITVTGAPVGIGYCHPFTLWPSDAVRITAGADKVGSYRKGSNSLRQFCSVCGGHLMTKHPQRQLIDVHAAMIPDLPTSPGVHVNSGEAVLRTREGLPKQRDLPGSNGRLIGA